MKSVIHNRYRQGWRFLTLWEGFGVEEATWEPRENHLHQNHLLVRSLYIIECTYGNDGVTCTLGQ